jgi:hypothetical protein
VEIRVLGVFDLEKKHRPAISADRVRFSIVSQKQLEKYEKH